MPSKMEEECYDMIASQVNAKAEHEYRDQITWAFSKVARSSWIGPALARATCAFISKLVFTNSLAYAKSVAENEYEIEARTWAMSASMQKLFAKMLQRHLENYFLTRSKEGRP